MTINKNEISTLINKGIDMYESVKNYNQLKGNHSFYIEHCNRIFYNEHIIYNTKNKIAVDLLNKKNQKHAEFKTAFSNFAKKNNLDMKKFLKIENDHEGDWNLALLIAILEELKELDNYKFIFMGVAFNPAVFFGDYSPINLAGELSCLLALSLIVIPFILFTQPISLPAFVVLTFLCLAVSFFMMYTGLTIGQNQMPFLYDCPITQLFGRIEPKFVEIEEYSCSLSDT